MVMSESRPGYRIAQAILVECPGRDKDWTKRENTGWGSRASVRSKSCLKPRVSAYNRDQTPSAFSLMRNLPDYLRGE